MPHILPQSKTAFMNRMEKVKKREKMNPSASPLKATYDMFRDSLGLYDEISYIEWLAFDDCYKAAALYVNFYKEISLAWFKSRSIYSPEEDGVSIVLQYLQKNVPIIVADERRFNAKYIYRVAYNCMFCQARDIKRDREAFENETSNICDGVDGAETNIFNYIVGENFEDSFESDVNRSKFWSIVESMGDDTMSVINGILTGDNVPKKIRDRSDEILEELRVRLSIFQDRSF